MYKYACLHACIHGATLAKSNGVNSIQMIEKKNPKINVNCFNAINSFHSYRQSAHTPIKGVSIFTYQYLEEYRAHRFLFRCPKV